ncbi:hypothetical protein Gotri_012740 [Gossypium trilobum]|uniref:Uncharacterized protein n=1 Tax=Gossypium trilobum TaxID=34281 RepID=A0A7J9DRD9_9ROSI|nr:hypothetical protein [Gossypium trilobum]
MAILQNLQEEDVEWRALWLIPDKFCTDAGALIGFRCLEFGELLGMHLCLY